MSNSASRYVVQERYVNDSEPQDWYDIPFYGKPITELHEAKSEMDSIAAIHRAGVTRWCFELRIIERTERVVTP